MTQGIYALYFDTADDRYYIGKSLAGIESRYLGHCSKLRSNTHCNYLLQNSYNEEHQLPILAILEDSCTTSNIDAREVYWIREFDSYKNGLNLTIGGEGSAPGENHPRALYSASTYLNILKGLDQEGADLRKLSRALGVSYDVCSNIAYGLSHLYLKEVHPEIYDRAMSKTGSRIAGARHSTDISVYESVFKELATTTCSMKSIADRHNINLSIVADINKGQSHKYLHIKFPEYYNMILCNRGKLIRSAKIWPSVKSPEGLILTPINMAQFCRDNNLDSGGFSRLLNGKQKSIKGWTLA